MFDGVLRLLFVPVHLVADAPLTCPPLPLPLPLPPAAVCVVPGSLSVVVCLLVALALRSGSLLLLLLCAFVDGNVAPCELLRLGFAGHEKRGRRYDIGGTPRGRKDDVLSGGSGEYPRWVDTRAVRSFSLFPRTSCHEADLI